MATIITKQLHEDYRQLRHLLKEPFRNFRWLTVGFSIAAIIVMVQILDVLHLDRSNKLQENTSIQAQDHQTRFNRPLELATVWKEIKKLGNSVSLYPANYNVERVRWALQSAKIIKAKMMRGDTALKWAFVLDGNQRVLFKPSLQSRRLETSTHGQYGCEYPEYEITGFALNRMLDLRNMPFTVGRKFNWFTDIAPVANESLTTFVNITQDGDVCILWRCPYGKRFKKIWKTYCFPKGNISGSVMVWLDHQVHRERPQNSTGPWPLYHPRRSRPNVTLVHHDLLLGDDSFCKWFRTTNSYKKDGRFVNILDMAVMNYIMASSDSKDTYFVNDKKKKVNVFIDLGKSFYPDNLRLLAPIYQCCKIRKKVYDALIKLQYNFEEAFNNETKTDQLYPVLDFDEINAMKTRIHTILKFVEMCQYRYEESSVYLNI